MEPLLGTILIYARDMQKTAKFYSEFFGFETDGRVVEGLIELIPKNGGATILIHQAAKSLKLGQVAVKLTFHVSDVAGFTAKAAVAGLQADEIREGGGLADRAARVRAGRERHHAGRDGRG